jgi:superfamily II RNA helicase
MLQVAAGLSSGDCLVLTELLFNGSLSSLTATQLASVVSCFVWSENSDRGMPKVRDDLQPTFACVRNAAKQVGRVQEDCGMSLDVNAYMASFRPDLSDAVTLWANGASFLQVWIASSLLWIALVHTVHESCFTRDSAGVWNSLGTLVVVSSSWKLDRKLLHMFE